LSPSSEYDVVLAVISATRVGSKESRHSINSFLRFLNLNCLVEGEGECGIDEGVCSSLSETMKLEIPYLDNVDVITVELCNGREAAKLARRGSNVEEGDVAVRRRLRGVGSSRRGG